MEKLGQNVTSSNFPPKLESSKAFLTKVHRIDAKLTIVYLKVVVQKFLPSPVFKRTLWSNRRLTGKKVAIGDMTSSS